LLQRLIVVEHGLHRILLLKSRLLVLVQVAVVLVLELTMALTQEVAEVALESLKMSLLLAAALTQSH
jgi:hypothetical protein